MTSVAVETMSHQVKHEALGMSFLGILAMAVLLCALAMSPAAMASSSPTFGSNTPGLFNLKGMVYFLEPNTQQMPDSLERMNPAATIYTTRLDIPPRVFSEGLPEVADRSEWFGILYAGIFQTVLPGSYTWRIASDDGARLWIDDKEIITNDGIHAETSADAKVELIPGNHALKVWYFQGPAQSIALGLFITPPSGVEKIFSVADYSSDLAATIGRLHAEATDRGVRVRFAADTLFGAGGTELAASAIDTMAAVARFIQSYPGCGVRIEGYTDNALDNAASRKLSLDRANGVKTALIRAGLPEDTRIETAGLGRERPVASNRTVQGRAQNRRLEIYIGP